MKKQITTILMGIMLLSLASAVTIYAGDCKDIDISSLENPDNILYTVVENSSDMTGMNITNNNKTISVCFNQRFKSDSFTLVFFDNATREIIPDGYVKEGSRSGGGGGSHTRYVDKNVTIYVPEYINTTEEVEKIVEVEKIIDNIIIIETGYKLWHILLGVAVSSIIIWFIFLRGKTEED